jgi:hypothetical protein
MNPWFLGLFTDFRFQISSASGLSEIRHIGTVLPLAGLQASQSTTTDHRSTDRSCQYKTLTGPTTVTEWQDVIFY